jgi:hypothetical protein
MGMSSAFPITVSGNYGPVPADGGYVIIAGVSVGETAGSTASITLREGTVTGKVIGRFNFTANGSTSFGELPHVRCQGQLYVVVVGAISGAIYFK